MFNRLKLPLIALLIIAGIIGIVSLTRHGGLTSASAANDTVDVALHKAIYDFKLVSAQSGAGLSGISGKMYYEQDDDCDAWTTEHRFTVSYEYPERKPLVNTSHYVSWESKDGNKFSFNSDRQEDGQTVEQLRGAVTRKPDTTATAEYVRPSDLSFALPAGYFLPNAHTNEIIRHARAGDKFFDAVMFDGTDADGPVNINTFIGKKVTADELKAITDAHKEIDASLLVQEAWHVHMAFFPLKDKDAMEPAYEMDIILHGNSVVSYVLVDYKTFKVEQNLLAIDKLTGKKCS